MSKEITGFRKLADEFGKQLFKWWGYRISNPQYELASGPSLKNDLYWDSRESSKINLKIRGIEHILGFTSSGRKVFFIVHAVSGDPHLLYSVRARTEAKIETAKKTEKVDFSRFLELYSMPSFDFEDFSYGGEQRRGAKVRTGILEPQKIILDIDLLDRFFSYGRKFLYAPSYQAIHESIAEKT
jgi:hypothetical protein